MTNTAENLSSSESGAILVVTSKVKKFIRDISSMNTAGDVPEALTKIVEVELQKAIKKAKDAGRKTVMARDFQ
jgi:histone H3/H4